MSSQGTQFRAAVTATMTATRASDVTRFFMLTLLKKERTKNVCVFLKTKERTRKTYSPVYLFVYLTLDPGGEEVRRAGGGGGGWGDQR